MLWQLTHVPEWIMLFFGNPLLYTSSEHLSTISHLARSQGCSLASPVQGDMCRHPTILTWARVSPVMGWDGRWAPRGVVLGVTCRTGGTWQLLAPWRVSSCPRWAGNLPKSLLNVISQGKAEWKWKAKKNSTQLSTGWRKGSIFHLPTTSKGIKNNREGVRAGDTSL